MSDEVVREFSIANRGVPLARVEFRDSAESSFFDRWKRSHSALVVRVDLAADFLGTLWLPLERECKEIEIDHAVWLPGRDPSHTTVALSTDVLFCLRGELIHISETEFAASAEILASHDVQLDTEGGSVAVRSCKAGILVGLRPEFLLGKLAIFCETSHGAVNIGVQGPGWGLSARINERVYVEAGVTDGNLSHPAFARLQSMKPPCAAELTVALACVQSFVDIPVKLVAGGDVSREQLEEYLSELASAVAARGGTLLVSSDR